MKRGQQKCNNPPIQTRTVHFHPYHADDTAGLQPSSNRAMDPDEMEADLALQQQLNGISNLAGSLVNFRNLLNGYHPTCSEDVARHIDRIEMIPAMVRPTGCAPVAPINWVIFRTYARIIELREGHRMDDNGFTLGDRDFKRFRQRAVRRIHEEQVLSDTHRRSIFEHSFRFIFNKLWHRYMLPFGSFAYNIPTNSTSKMEQRYRANMHTCQGSTISSNLCINPYSVTEGDILYLCNTSGYMERFIELINTVLDARQQGKCNLLEHRRYDGPDFKPQSPMDRYYTAEKYLHFIGSLWLHLEVIKRNERMQGGHWERTRAMLESLYNTVVAEFNIRDTDAEPFFKLMTLRSVNGSLGPIQAFFKQATHPSESTK